MLFLADARLVTFFFLVLFATWDFPCPFFIVLSLSISLLSEDKWWSVRSTNLMDLGGITRVLHDAERLLPMAVLLLTGQFVVGFPGFLLFLHSLHFGSPFPSSAIVLFETIFTLVGAFTMLKLGCIMIDTHNVRLLKVKGCIYSFTDPPVLK